MNKKDKLHFDSRVIHDAIEPDQWHGSTLPPIFQSASTKHETAISLSDTFAGILSALERFPIDTWP